MILITGAHKAFALYKAIEEGVNHMWTVSAFQQHPRTIFICDEDATLELRVKTVKYFKGTSAAGVMMSSFFLLVLVFCTTQGHLCDLGCFNCLFMRNLGSFRR